ncbi:MAG: NAD(P)/FAD-dependent oxidoreductase [Pirellulales bacterium]
MTHANQYEVIIIGAGAAGLMAAIRAAERGRRTLLLEKNRKPGVKILMSGGTRCNITHDCDAAGIIAAFGSAGQFLHSALAALSPHDLLDFFHHEGLATKVEPGGKVFPESDRAVDVLNALLNRLRGTGAELALAEPVARVARLIENAAARPAAFEITTNRRTLRCNALLITTGGKSYSGCGTTGDGYRWLAEFGHSIRRPRPALVPLISDEPWVHDLAGITIHDVELSVKAPNAAADEPPKSRRSRPALPPGVLIRRRGSLLFTHFGLSGPAVLDVSRAVTAVRNPGELELVADFLPNSRQRDFENQLRQAATHDGKRLIATLLADDLPRRLVDALVGRAAIPADRRVAEFSSAEQSRLVAQLKSCPIRITGTRGFEKAEVTAGGVALEEVDSRTMRSKLVPGLYLAGEILDLDGFIGGYNFQAAFSTAHLAGENI